VSKRLSLILGDDEHAQLEPFLDAESAQHQALLRWATEHGVGSVTSEAAAIRVLLRVGVEALRDDALDAGYAELAAEYSGSDVGDERRVARDRYVERTEAAM
jgi:hypothetical protein